MIEQLFSVYGQHINAEQSMALKEAIVAAVMRLAGERAERTAEGMRAKPLTPAKRAMLPAAQAHTGELGKNDENLAQLELMCSQMLKRMRSTTAADVAAGATFTAKRKARWELLAKHEQKAAAGAMAAKRAKGTAKLTTDTYSTVRGEKCKANEAAYLAEAEAEASPRPPSPQGSGQVDGGKNKPKRKRSF